MAQLDRRTKTTTAKIDRKIFALIVDFYGFGLAGFSFLFALTWRSPRRNTAPEVNNAKTDKNVGADFHQHAIR